VEAVVPASLRAGMVLGGKRLARFNSEPERLRRFDFFCSFRNVMSASAVGITQAAAPRKTTGQPAFRLPWFRVLIAKHPLADSMHQRTLLSGLFDQPGDGPVVGRFSDQGFPAEELPKAVNPGYFGPHFRLWRPNRRSLIAAGFQPFRPPRRTDFSLAAFRETRLCQQRETRVGSVQRTSGLCDKGQPPSAFCAA